MSERRVGIYLMLIGCLVAGLVTGRTFFLSLTYLFAGLLIGAWLWARLSVAGIRVGRRTPARQTQVGRTFDEQFTVYNNSWLPKLWLEIRDGSTLPDHRASRVVPGLLPGRPYTWTTQTLCRERGEFTLGPVTLIAGDPFGLYQIKRQLPATASLLVYPTTVPILSFGAVAGDMSGGDADRRRTHFVTTNAAGIRDYMPGDSLNRIHWRSSARRDRLLVKEFEIDPQGDVWLWLDIAAETVVARDQDGLNNQSGVFIPPRSDEYTIAATASLAQYFLNAERAVGFIGYLPSRVVLPPDRGLRQLAEIMEALALARSVGALPLAQALALDGHLPGRGATLILLTADTSPDWGAEAYGLSRRGIKMVALLIDPASFGGSQRAEEQSLRLANGGITNRIVRYGDNLSAVLSL